MVQLPCIQWGSAAVHPFGLEGLNCPHGHSGSIPRSLGWLVLIQPPLSPVFSLIGPALNSHIKTMTLPPSFWGLKTDPLQFPGDRRGILSNMQTKTTLRSIGEQKCSVHRREAKPLMNRFLDSVPEGAPRDLDFRQGPRETGQRGMASHCQR